MVLRRPRQGVGETSGVPFIDCHIPHGQPGSVFGDGLLGEFFPLSVTEKAGASAEAVIIVVASFYLSSASLSLSLHHS